MGRPPVDIRAKLHTNGRYRIAYREAPDKWHLSPEATRAKALAWARRLKPHFLGKAPTLTLRPFMADFYAPGGAWIKRMQAKGQAVSAKVLGDYAAQVRNYLDPLFGESDPRALSAIEIDDAILSATARTGRPLANATKYKIERTLSVILADLAARGVVPSNPLFGFKPYSKAPQRPRSVIPRETLALLFPTSHGAAMRVWGTTWACACMALLYDTGMRPGEVRALKWEEINVKERAIVVRHAMKADGTIGTTKTGNVRGVRLSERTMQALAIWRAEADPAGEDDLMFPITGAGIAAAFKAGLRAIGRGDEPWTPYWLRHSFVTYALERLDSAEVTMLAGHSEAVSAKYRHPDDETVIKRTRAARGKLD